MNTDERRPDPDRLLARLHEQTQRAARGRLRIYFGASAGVGKTCAMLAAGAQLQANGIDVVAGLVETHARADTAALMAGLALLPRKQLAYRGRTLEEFDIDAALARKPALLLLDELAHTNAPGSRHPKRWQDVEELLDAGIDVFTTVNVQHLESLNDVVGGITGISVTETLPDTLFDNADEVVLVDLPADELLARLKAGKVYQEQQAQRAAQNFFRKGNLMALRELALRRTADRIAGDVQAYRVEKSIHAVWKTDVLLLACIGSHEGAEQLVRSAARLAAQLNAGWHAVYIETPRLQKLPSAQRERILRTLKLAGDLGATTSVLAGSDASQAAVQYARSHNISRIVLERETGLRRWRHRVDGLQVGRIAALAPDVDLIVPGRGTLAAASASASAAAASGAAGRLSGETVAVTPGKAGRWRGYVWSVVASLAVALATMPLRPHFALSNIVMLFLLAVVLVAVRLGRGPAMLSTVVSVVSFDYFFVAPRFSFAISDLQYLITFFVMLTVGLITSHLTAGLRYQARVASHRETRSRALYEFARALSAALQTDDIFALTREVVQRTVRAPAMLLLPDADGRLQAPDDAAGDVFAIDLVIAQWAYDNATAAGLGTDTLPGSALFYLPLVAPMRTRGILAIDMGREPESRRWMLIPEQRQQLDTFAKLAAIALERVHYIDVAQEALLHMETERLRNSLLSALSHDLRTPLTSLVGWSEALATSRPPLPDEQLGMARALHAESLRMTRLVSNLLDMARIESGVVHLRLEWQAVEEAVGGALRASGAQLSTHRVSTQLAPGLPLVRFDAVLIERVLCNLVENAAKYTPAGSHIEISAAVQAGQLTIAVCDDGPGLPQGREEALFGKFVRGQRESATPGVGLGLAICRAIVEAHGGRIVAENRPGGGACFRFSLPLGTPPALPLEDEGLAADTSLTQSLESP